MTETSLYDAYLYLNFGYISLIEERLAAGCTVRSSNPGRRKKSFLLHTPSDRSWRPPSLHLPRPPHRLFVAYYGNKYIIIFILCIPRGPFHKVLLQLYIIRDPLKFFISVSVFCGRLLQGPLHLYILTAHYVKVFFYLCKLWGTLIHSVICLTTGPKPPPKRCLHIVQSRASSFK